MFSDMHSWITECNDVGVCVCKCSQQRAIGLLLVPFPILLRYPQPLRGSHLRPKIKKMLKYPTRIEMTKYHK